MLKHKILICIILAACLVIPLVAYGAAGRSAAQENKETSKRFENSVEDNYYLDINKSIAVAVVNEKSEGPFEIGAGILSESCINSQQLKCDILYFYNESRIKETARLSDKNPGEMDNWCFSNLSGFEAQGDIVIDNAFRKQQREIEGHHLVVNDTIYLDWRYRDSVKEGDVILVDLGVHKWINPNQGIGETTSHLVANPVTMDGSSPHVAHFNDGILELDAEDASVFDLRRLYPDDEPDFSAIHNGDSVESVIAFLIRMEHDIARYRDENPECYVEVKRPEMIVSGKDLICKAKIDAMGKNIEAKMDLYGFDEKLIATWTASGKDSIVFEETVPAEFSVVYSLKVSGTADGEILPYNICRSFVGYPD